MARYSRFHTSVVATGLAMMCVGGAASAQVPCEAAELFDVEGGLSDLFGHAVAIDGDTAVVGAVYDDDNAWHAGAAYVFRLDPDASWVQEQKLLPDDGVAAYDFFGNAVAVVGDTAVIGVPLDDDNGEDSGSAYVFRFDGMSWVQVQKILPDDGAAGDEFGTALAVEGGTLVIGARFDDDNGIDSGSAYVFVEQDATWVQVQKLLATDAVTAEERFGRSVAIDNGTVVVGAIDYDTVDHAVSAFVYAFDAAASRWTQAHELPAPDGSGPVAISGDRILVGSSYDEQNGAGPISGSARIFRFDGSSWNEEQVLVASDAAPFNAFGHAVTLAGDTAVVAAPGHDHGCPDPEVYGNCSTFGAAYVYRYDGQVWVQVAELPSRRTNPGGDNFGRAVAIGGETLLVGATYALGNGQWSGSAYVFDLDPIFGDVDCDGAVGITDLLALLAAWGPNADHPADLDGDGVVGITDFLLLLASWG